MSVWRSERVAGAAAAFASASGGANFTSTANHATSTYTILGCDAVDDTVFVNDATGGSLRQSADLGATWSNNKTWPANVTFANVRRILRFGAHLYLLARDTTDNLWKVWRAEPEAGNTAFTWSAPLHAMSDTGAQGFFTGFDADASYIYLSEYGDPVGGPTAWRTADGETWEEIYPADATIRHIHAIAPDPYRPGHVYMTCGDGAAKTIQRSTDYGDTWEVIVASSVWQGVQVSFTPSLVFVAGDSQRGMVWTMDRTELVPRWYSPSILKMIAVPTPAAITDAFYGNAYFAVVDPDTGVWYASAQDASAGGNTPALFQITGKGQPAALIEKYTSAMSPVLIYGGYLWVGKYRRLLA